jgi:5-deoxy-glucuronate isomerase
MSWLRRGETVITPESAGWEYCGMQIFDFSKSKSYSIKMDQKEGVLLSLSAENIEVLVNNEKFKLQGRPGVFAGISDWIYIPVGSELSISANSGLVALSTAQSSKLYPVAYKDKSEVSIELRGSGFATRQVNNIATPDSFAEADRILVCEVLTPGGNWSSWPPHRHDGIAGCEFTNEEIYYFQIGTNESDHGAEVGHGFFKVYSYDGFPMDITAHQLQHQSTQCIS